MRTTLGIVEVQPAIVGLSPQSPLAGIARRKFGGKTLLEWVVRRISDSQKLDRLVVLAHDDPQSRCLVEGCPPDTQVFFSSAADPLARFAAVVRRTGCDAALRMNVSHPFVDPVLIDRLIAAADSSDDCDYASFVFPDGRPTMASNVGVFTEWCRAGAVLDADSRAACAEDRATATCYLCSHPNRYCHKLLPAPQRLDRSDLQLAICNEEDWDHVQTLLDALGPEFLDWQHIASLLDRQPRVRQRLLDRHMSESED